MDMLDQSLDSSAAAASHDKGQEVDEVVELHDGDETSPDDHTAVAIATVQQAAFADHNIQYQFRTESNGGQVTYRVVQVTDGQLDGQGDATGAVSVVSTTAFTGTPQAVAQAVIQNPFSNGGSPSTDAVSGEARFAYFPASTVGDTTAVSVQTTDPALTQAGGQFYVMMTPQDVLPAGSQRSIAPRTHPYSPPLGDRFPWRPEETPTIVKRRRSACPDENACSPLAVQACWDAEDSSRRVAGYTGARTRKMDGNRTPRDERRRAQHNEVERRRRDKINNWIVQLSKIIPDCNMESSKTGAQSKGGILSKACDYIRELRQTNQRLQESFKEAERLQMDNEMLRQQMEDHKNENTVLRTHLQQHGIEVVEEAPRQ